MIDFKELERRLDDALNAETSESLKSWISDLDNRDKEAELDSCLSAISESITIEKVFSVDEYGNVSEFSMFDDELNVSVIFNDNKDSEISSEFNFEINTDVEEPTYSNAA